MSRDIIDPLHQGAAGAGQSGSERGPSLVRYPKGVGDIVGDKYRLDSVLGASGMGVVFAATHRQIERKVAIKFLLHKATIEPETLRRFALEAKVMGKIRSRHVVQVLDVGSIDEGIPYIVMEHLAGEDLSQVSRSEGLTVGDAISYMLQTSEGLAAAHAAGVIHRDIKPSNIFLVKEPDGTRTVKVIDFGIAKFRGTDTSSGASDGTLTQTATLVGSPRYMSPEQAMESRDVDARTDVWSLGVILYELLVGAPLFKADSMTQVLVSVLSKPIPHPSDVAAHVPRALGDVIMRALTRDREERTPSVEQFAQEIAPFAGQFEGARLERIRQVVESSVSLPRLDETEATAMPASEAGTGTTRSWASRSSAADAVGTTGAPSVVRPVRSKLTGFLAVGLAACAVLAGFGAATTRRTQSPTPQPVPAASTALAASAAPPSPAPIAPAREVRVAVPAGARVEIDGLPEIISDGTVVVAGTLGSTHRVKAVLEGRTAEIVVAITENGPIPPALSLPAALASAPPARGAARPPPLASPPKSPATAATAAPPPSQNAGLVRSFE